MSRFGSLIGAAVLVAAAGWLRAVHLDWGFPEIFEEATPVREAIQMWGVPGSGIDPNPHFFKYPSFTFYLNFFLQAVWYLWLSLVGTAGSLNEFRQILGEQFPQAVLLGRWLQVGLGALLVIPTRRLGDLLAGPVAGWTAALLVAVLPVTVSESRLVSPDMALTLAAVWALVAATRIAKEGETSQYLWCGLWIGLATASKYPGALLLGALLAGHWIQVRRGAEGPASLVLSTRLLQGFTVAGLAFFAAAPFVFLDPATAAADFGFERRHMIWGHLGREEGRAISFYLLDAFPRGWTLGVVVASLLGLGSLLAQRSTLKRVLPGLVFFALTLLVLGSWKMAAPRYILPLAPLGAVWAGAAVAAVAGRFGNSGRARAMVGGLLAALLLVLPMRESLENASLRGRQDSRLAARQWIEANVPEGDSILLERYGPDPSPDRWIVLYLPFHSVNPHIYDAAYFPELYADFDYIVLSTGVSARYLAQPREYPVQSAFYYAVDQHFQEVAAMRPGTYNGPGIRILKRREDRPLPDPSRIPRLVWEPHRGNTALAEHLSALGTVYVRDKREDLGFEMLQLAVDLAPESAITWGNFGAMNLREGRLENALTAFRRARDLAPEDAGMWMNLATLFGRMGESSQAAEAYQRVMALRPEAEEAYIGLARALIEEDHFGQARAVLQEFLNRFPRSPRRAAAEEALENLRFMGPGRP